MLIMYYLKPRMKKITPLLLLFILALGVDKVSAQYGEPEIKSIEAPKNLFDEGYKTGFGFSFNLNDFGFGVGTQFRKGLGSYTEGLLNLKIAGLRDPSEQTYIDYYFGNRTIPSKYKRVITFPATIGLKRRVFARHISDNFRVHTSMSIGPVLALTTPYFIDSNGNGFRENNINVYGTFEPTQDIFQGFKDSETKWGWTGDLVFGIDFGDNFARLQTFQFGYSFYYFKDGIQILEPFQPQRNANGSPIFVETPAGSGFFELQTEAYNDPTDYFGSAQITFIFGWMW